MAVTFAADHLAARPAPLPFGGRLITADMVSLMYGSDDLATDLSGLGLRTGDGVFVHCALSRIGHVIGGPRGLIEAFIKVVGEAGLIAMPGFSRDAYDPTLLDDFEGSAADVERLREQVPGFDQERSNVRQNGAVPEAFRNWPGVARSPHPTSSVLLWGADKVRLTARHDPMGWPTGPDTPWAELRYRKPMKILLIGVGWNRCSALHAAESAARHKRTVTRRFKMGGGKAGEWVEAPDVADDLGRLFPLVGAAWEAKGGVVNGMVGNAESRLTDYDGLVTFASDWIDRRNREDGVVGTANDTNQ